MMVNSHVVQGLRFKVYPKFNVIEDFILHDDGHSHVIYKVIGLKSIQDLR